MGVMEAMSEASSALEVEDSLLLAGGSHGTEREKGKKKGGCGLTSGDMWAVRERKKNRWGSRGEMG